MLGLNIRSEQQVLGLAVPSDPAAGEAVDKWSRVVPTHDASVRLVTVTTTA